MENAIPAEADMVQCTSTVIMVRPRHFMPHADTAVDNEFQKRISAAAARDIAHRARAEVDAAVTRLEEAGVRVMSFEDGETLTPDSAFPNNWISTHPEGQVVLYPLLSPKRRPERRLDILSALRARYAVGEVIDITSYEQEGRFLEGTGALVFDYVTRTAYATVSRRADPKLITMLCARLGIEAVVFETEGPSGYPIYHTNVMMCICTDIALVGLGMIRDTAARDTVRRRLLDSGRDVIELSNAQVASFAGNAIELEGAWGRVLALSNTAYRSLRPEQLVRIRASMSLLPLDMPTVELSGGSARCTMVSIHLRRHPARQITNGRSFGDVAVAGHSGTQAVTVR